MGPKVSIADVARCAGVSPSTASLVLNGRARQLRLRKETASRVRDAAQKLGYFPYFHSRAVRHKSTRTLGFLVRNDMSDGLIGSAIFAEFLSGANRCAIERGLMLVMAKPPGSAAVDAMDPVILRERCLDGAIIFYGLEGHARRAYEKQRLPTVWLDADVRDRVNCVFRDETEAYTLATEYLLELGHRNILYFHPECPDGPVQHISNPLALEGYLTAMRRAGREPAVVPYDAPDPDHASVVERSLERNPRPTAFVGPRAMHTYHALLKLGLRVPEDASVVTCGYRSEFHYVMPGMTELTFDRRWMGYEAAEMLCRLIHTGRDQPSVVYKSRIVPRETTMRIGPSLLTAARREILLRRMAQ